MELIKHALLNEDSLKAVKGKLGMGKSRMCVLTDKDIVVIAYLGMLVKAGEEFCAYLFGILNNLDANDRGSGAEELDTFLKEEKWKTKIKYRISVQGKWRC